MGECIGKVYLVGAGSGDPGLITVKGAECIRTADVVVYDYLVGTRLLDQRRPDSELVYVGKKGGRHTMKQDDINRLLVDKARENKVVCRLKGGDPFVFGRGGEEALELVENGIPFEVVPGVTAAVAVPAYAGIPVTHRALTSTFALVTGHEDPTKESSSIDWSKLAAGIGTLAFYMGVRNLPVITDQLVKHGRDPETPVAVIRWGTTTRQKTVVGTLADVVDRVREAGVTAPAIILVGEVVSLREKLNWFETRPLFGWTVLVTRARAQASELVDMLELLGAHAIEFPTIRVENPDDFGPMDKAIDGLDTVDWLVFTSVNGVTRFMDRLRMKNLDVRELKGIKLCAIGSATCAAIESYSINVDLVPPKYVAESVAETMAAEDMAGKHVLIPRACVARSYLPEKLAELGAEVNVVDAYKTVPDTSDHSDTIEMLQKGEIDFVTFTSSSTVRHFVDMVGKDIIDTIKVQYASIGPITSRTAEELGLDVHTEAGRHDIPGLVEAIVKSAENDGD